MTLLAILPGQPAKGERQPAATAEDYRNLTPSQRDKLLAALAKRQPPVAETLPGCVNTEVQTGAELAACGCCSKTGSSADSSSRGVTHIADRILRYSAVMSSGANSNSDYTPLPQYCCHASLSLFVCLEYIAWQVVEEFMSIADGQLVLHPSTPHSLHTPGSSSQPETSQQQVGRG